MVKLLIFNFVIMEIFFEIKKLTSCDFLNVKENKLSMLDIICNSRNQMDVFNIVDLFLESMIKMFDMIQELLVTLLER